MTQEVPFTFRTSRATRQAPDLAMFPDALSEYGKGLGILARRLMWHHDDGIVTLGSSAEDMWQDLRSVSLRSLAILPKAEHVTGNRAYDLYRGNLFDMEPAYRRSGVQLNNKVIVDDYANRAIKIIKLDGLFKHLGFAVRFAVLYATPHALWEFADYNIPVFVALEKTNSNLQELLETRRTKRKFGR